MLLELEEANACRRVADLSAPVFATTTSFGGGFLLLAVPRTLADEDS